MGETRKTITLGDFLTRDEIERCIALYRELHATGRFAATVVKEIMEPNMARINAAVGQENDPHYLAYVVEYAMIQATK